MVVVTVGSPLAAQELPLRRDYPGSRPFECPAPRAVSEPSPEDRAQAGVLASDADQALILGDEERADELLARAAELDPTSADYAYRRATVLEDRGLLEDAMLEYCRAIALDPDDPAVLEDSRATITALDELLRERISDSAREHFVAGLRAADAGLYPDAVGSFTAALTEVPEWPEALYNRAVVLEAMDLIPESLADYRLYLSLRADDIEVAERVGRLEGLASAPTPSPRSTLAFGVLFPGMGHYYSGRSRLGTVVLGAAVSAVVTGFFVKEVTVRCLNPVPSGGDCPPNDVVDETTERPYLGPALGVAAAVTLGAAIEAYVRARNRRAEQEADAEAPDANGVRLSGPSMRSNGGRLDLNLLSLRFR